MKLFESDGLAYQMEIDRLEKITLVYADDDPDDRMLFAAAIDEIEGNIKFYPAVDGNDLNIVLEEIDHQPDIVFIDINMPLKTGLECLAELRANPRNSQLPIIMISTSRNQSIADKALSMGASHFICKPTDFAELKRQIKSCIQQFAV